MLSGPQLERDFQYFSVPLSFTFANPGFDGSLSVMVGACPGAVPVNGGIPSEPGRQKARAEGRIPNHRRLAMRGSIGRLPLIGTCARQPASRGRWPC